MVAICSRSSASRWRSSKRRPRLLADLLGQAQHLDALSQDARHLVHPCGEIDRLQDLLLLLGRDVHIGGGQVGELGGRGVLDRHHQLLRRLRQELDGFERLTLQVEEAGLHLGGAGVGFGDGGDARHRERGARQKVEDTEALDALADDMVGAVGGGDVAHDIGQRADAVKILGAGIGGLGVALQDDADLPLLAHRLLRSGDRFGPAQRDRRDDAGVKYDAAHRQQDSRIRGQLDAAGRRRRLGGGRIGGRLRFGLVEQG